MKMCKCLICGALYPEDDIIYHLEYNHWDIVEERGLWESFEYLEQEKESREWTDIEQERIRPEPIKTMPSVPQDLLPSGWIREEVQEYPYKPFYYYPSEQQYYCSEDKYLAKDFNSFLIHVLTKHPRDYENVLRHAVVETLKDKVAMDTNKRTIQELVERQIQRWLLEAEQKEPEALYKHVEEHFNSLLEYLKGNTNTCPYCNTEALINNKLHLDKIHFCLVKGAMEMDARLRKKFESYKQKYGYYPYMGNALYECTWDDKKVFLKLHPLLHVYQDHNTAFKGLIKTGILKGELIDFLAKKKYLNKETEPPTLKATENKEKLDLNKSPIKIMKQVNLSKDEDSLLRWLDKERVKKT
jgi:hypothetical protein